MTVVVVPFASKAEAAYWGNGGVVVEDPIHGGYWSLHCWSYPGGRGKYSVGTPRNRQPEQPMAVPVKGFPPSLGGRYWVEANPDGNAQPVIVDGFLGRKGEEIMTEAELLRLAEAMYAIDSNRCSHWPTERLREAAQSIGMEIEGIETAIWWDAQCAYGQVWCAHNFGPQEPLPVQPVQLSLVAETAQK